MKRIVVKPCPFCGNPATVREALQEEYPSWAESSDEWWTVECSSRFCLIHPKISLWGKWRTIFEWNTRNKANRLTYSKKENTIEVEEHI